MSRIMLRVTRPSTHDGQVGGNDSIFSRRNRRPSPDATSARTASVPRSGSGAASPRRRRASRSSRGRRRTRGRRPQRGPSSTRCEELVDRTPVRPAHRRDVRDLQAAAAGRREADRLRHAVVVQPRDPPRVHGCRARRVRPRSPSAPRPRSGPRTGPGSTRGRPRGRSPPAPGPRSSRRFISPSSPGVGTRSQRCPITDARSVLCPTNRQRFSGRPRCSTTSRYSPTDRQLQPSLSVT